MLMRSIASSFPTHRAIVRRRPAAGCGGEEDGGRQAGHHGGDGGQAHHVVSVAVADGAAGVGVQQGGGFAKAKVQGQDAAAGNLAEGQQAKLRGLLCISEPAEQPCC